MSAMLNARHTAKWHSRIFIARRNISVQHDVILRNASATPGVMSLLLNRPERKNALSIKLIDQLQDAISTVANDPSARVLILGSSTQNAFCAGADLKERLDMSYSQTSKFLHDMRRAFTSLENLPIPTIAAIDGPALGGGLELSLTCDLRVAGDQVKAIGFPETRLGIIPGAGGTQRAVRLIGISRAKDLIYTARILSAPQALRYGLVDYVAEPNKSALDRALELAEEIAVGAPLALRAAKSAIGRAVELDIEEGLDYERASYEPLLSSQDRVIALRAFKEKRKPIFIGA